MWPVDFDSSTEAISANGVRTIGYQYAKKKKKKSTNPHTLHKI